MALLSILVQSDRPAGLTRVRVTCSGIAHGAYVQLWERTAVLPGVPSTGPEALRAVARALDALAEPPTPSESAESSSAYGHDASVRPQRSRRPRT